MATKQTTRQATAATPRTTKKKAAATKKKATAKTTKKKEATAPKTKATAPKTKAAPAKKMTPASPEKMARVAAYSFASIYALYVKKVERKGRTRAELDEVIGWLTGYRGATLQRVLDEPVDLEHFFAGATLNPNAGLITGVICGVRIEDLEDPLMKQIRWLDKLVDELAQGRAMERILRSA